MRKLLTLTAAAAFALSVGFTSVAQAVETDLSGWTVENYPGAASNWELGGGNLSVTQKLNGLSTLFYSDFNAQGFTTEGVVEV